jgi:hypothetical protein
MTDDGFTSVIVTPDSYDATAYALAPDSSQNNCPAGHWEIVVDSNIGQDVGFYFMAN